MGAHARTNELFPGHGGNAAENVFVVDLGETARLEKSVSIARVFKRSFLPEGATKLTPVCYRLRALIFVSMEPNSQDRHFVTASLEHYGFHVRDDLHIYVIESLEMLHSGSRLYVPCMAFYQQDGAVSQAQSSDLGRQPIIWRQ